MKDVVVPLELINKILTYLGTRPYVEVYQLIPEIMKLDPKPEPKKP